jgi:hypothetical protein
VTAGNDGGGAVGKLDRADRAHTPPVGPDETRGRATAHHGREESGGGIDGPGSRRCGGGGNRAGGDGVGLEKAPERPREAPERIGERPLAFDRLDQIGHQGDRRGVDQVRRDRHRFGCGFHLAPCARIGLRPGAGARHRAL